MVDFYIPPPYEDQVFGLIFFKPVNPKCVFMWFGVALFGLKEEKNGFAVKERNGEEGNKISKLFLSYIYSEFCGEIWTLRLCCLWLMLAFTGLDVFFKEILDRSLDFSEMDRSGDNLASIRPWIH